MIRMRHRGTRARRWGARAAVRTTDDAPHAPVQRPGNQAMQRLLSGHTLQAKLTVNTPGDRYEQEADRVAEQVMRMPEPGRAAPRPHPPAIQRMCSECEEELHRRPEPPRIQRMCSECEQELEDDHLQAKEAPGQAPEVGPGTAAGIASLRGGGRPLPSETRAFLEPRFGRDFSNVRVHTDARAAGLARAVQAQAFTVGRDVVFGAGAFRPETQAGRRLLAHELTHVVQQGSAGPEEVQRQTTEEEEEELPTGRSSGTPVPDVQRTIGDGHDLTATRFAGNRVLEAVYDNERLIRNGSSGTAVRLIQESLLAQGFNLPTFGADGIFGNETETAVRDFQIDTGAQKLDGIVGPETMGLLDMHDPGGTTATGGAGGGGGAAPPAATGATFSESPVQPFAGYDDSVTPNWLVVPSDGRRQAHVAITPAGARPAFTSADPTVATVDTTPDGVVVTGVAKGTTEVRASEGGTTLDRLRITVKDRRTETTAIHYVCDSAAPVPHCSNGAPPAETLRALLNQVWERQANVRFTDGGSANVVVPGDLGAAVDWTSPGGGEWNTVIATSLGANYNVFRVWDYLQDGVGTNGGANLVNNTMLADASCADGWGLPHEAGHFLGLDHPDGFIMTPCGGRVNQRVSKAMVDKVNP